ncbi:MAG: hypothetical protein ABW094_13335, partial [Candidatus Thiodiazotropha sp.]
CQRMMSIAILSFQAMPKTPYSSIVSSSIAELRCSSERLSQFSRHGMDARGYYYPVRDSPNADDDPSSWWLKNHKIVPLYPFGMFVLLIESYITVQG